MITTAKDFEASLNKSKLSEVNAHADTHSDDSLLTRTSWVDAKTALAQIEKVCPLRPT